MTEEPSWRTELSAVDRYDVIQQIKSGLELIDPARRATSQSDAVAIETQAYDAATSLEQYHRLTKAAGVPPSREERKESIQEAFIEPSSSSGVRIGPYLDCQRVGSGVTSEVYKSKDRALKVIVATRNIEPHDPVREEKILKTLKPLCIPLLESFRDQEQRLVLVFPYQPFTLADIMAKGPIPLRQLRVYFRDLFSSLFFLHSQGIIHRDIKPSALLLESPDGPVWLSDFGTAWHPRLSLSTEPPMAKILDVGTGPYRAPELLFGNRAYDTNIDLWATGCLLAECCRDPPSPLFESRGAHEDGNQLGLILSIFKTLGTPTPETWPEATRFRTPPFDMYESFEAKTWGELLPGVDLDFVELVAALVRYDGQRATAEMALEFPAITGIPREAVVAEEVEVEA